VKHKLWFLFFVLFLSSCSTTDEPDYTKQLPLLKGHMNDYADLFSQSTRDSLEKQLKLYEEQTSNQIVILSVPSIGEKTIEEYSYWVAESWKIGQKGKDNGILITVAKEEKKVRIEVGYGLEGALPDGRCWYIIKSRFLSEVSGKYKDFDKAIEQTVEAIQLSIAGEFSAVEKKVEDKENSLWFIGALIIAAALAGFIGLLLDKTIVSSVATAIVYPLVWLAFWPPDALVLIGLIALGALIGFIARYFIEAGLEGSGGSSGGGYYGGGSSSSGFFGGGGSFGGGGASGGW